MKHALLALFSAFFALGVGAQPAWWIARGPGGGGSFFSPSINPANENEFYVACDMTEVFHTSDWGASFDFIPFQKLQGGLYARMQFTNVANTRYCLNYSGYYPMPAKTTNGGNSWLPLPGTPYNDEECLRVYADYNNPNLVVIFFYNQIFVSQNGGTTFSLKYTAADPGTGVLGCGAFFDGANIYLGTNEGIVRSTDGGTTFSLLSATGIPSTEALISFAGAKQAGTVRFFCVTANKSDVWATLAPWDYWGLSKGVYAMDNANGTWSAKSNGINFANKYITDVAMAENDINTCYLSGTDGAIYAPLILKTTNAGTSWASMFQATNNANIGTGWCGHQGDVNWGWPEVFFDIAVARNNKEKVLTTDFGFVHKTDDGGTTWHQAYVNAADENPANASTPKYKKYRSIGLEPTTNWQVFWSDPNYIYGCYSDIKASRTKDGGKTWSFDYTGHTQNSMYRMVKHNTSNILYAATSDIHDMYQTTRLTDAILNPGTGKIIFSTDNGQVWQDLHNFGDIVIWVATDPTNANRLYASVVNNTAGGIFKTDNLQNGAASTWVKLPNPPRTEGHPYNIKVLNDGKVLVTYCARRNATGAFTASSGVFLYDPATNTWADKSHINMQYYTKDIVVDPNDAAQNTWYACVWSGWGGPPNGKGGLYKTTNRGTSWTRLNERDRVSSVTFNPLNANEIYMTTETEGLWISSNINAALPTFQQVSSYPFRQPERVFFSPFNPNEMWITSFGNGIKTNCPLPFHFYVSHLNANAVTVLWDNVAAAASFQLRYHPVGSSTWTTVTTAVPSRALSGLTAAIPYEYQVRTKCGTQWTGWSPLQNFITGGTGGSCATPVPVSVYKSSPTSVKIYWNYVQGASSYKIRYRIAGASSWINTTATNAYNYKTINNLAAGTPYEYELAAVCPAGQTAWSTTATFTTWLPAMPVNEEVEDRQNVPSEKMIEEEAIVLFPNPVQDKLTLTGIPVGFTHAIIVDFTGRALQTVRLQAETQIIDVAQLPSGIYTLLLRAPSGHKWTSRFIVQ